MGKVENTRAEQHWMVPAMEKKKKLGVIWTTKVVVKRFMQTKWCVSDGTVKYWVFQLGNLKKKKKLPFFVIVGAHHGPSLFST